MPKSAFKQSDVTRAIRAAQAAGIPIGQVEIGPDGTIRLVPISVVDRAANPCDALLK